MLAPEVMSELAGQRITAVAQHRLTAEYARSGSQIFTVTTNDGQGPHFILKRVSLAWDWLMRSTKDVACRSVTLWQHGLFDQLPPEIQHRVLACARDGDGWAILMQDVGRDMLPFKPFTVEQNQFFMRAMAALHAQFWQQEILHNPAVGLSVLASLYQMFAPQTAQPEATGDNNIPRRVIEGWGLMPAMLPTDVVALMAQLLADPAPLCHALQRYPITLVHGDWRHANLAWQPQQSQLVLLDWQLAAAAPPAVELGRCLITNSPLLPVSKEETVEIYRQALAARLGDRFSAEWWEPQLALGLLGGFLQDGWALLLKATHWHAGEKHRAHWQADLPWWIARVREGARWL